jgi:D-threo-aldose 1-dehydrogenase
VKRHRIGRTDVYVSELGFGGAPIGNLYEPVPDEDAAAAVRTAWEGGIRYFDTAPHYGLGLSERRLGAALRDRPRDEFVISTKVGRLLVANPAPTGSDLAVGGFAVPDDLTRERDYSRDGVRRSLDASLDRLGLDRIDMVYIHDAEDHMEQALREAVPALIELREQGVVGAIGAGMNFVAPLLRFVIETDMDAVMLAGRWTLADRTGEPLVEACADRGVSVVAAAPFNSGCWRGRRQARTRILTTGGHPPTSWPSPAGWPSAATAQGRACRRPRCSSRCSMPRCPRWWPGCARRHRPGRT